MRLNHSRLAAAAGTANACRFLSGNFSKPFFLLLTTCWLLAAQGLHAQTTRYVNAAASPGGNGTSWANAYVNLQDAINISASGDEVWVAAGTYNPTLDPDGVPTPSDNRDKTFYLKNGVKVYGGFAGTETLRSQRNWTTNVTILSGDVGAPGFNADNCYHVVLSVNDGDATVLDGFTVEKGNASGGGIFTVESVAVGRAQGGGMHNFSHSSPTVSNCIFSGNASTGNGGGMFNYVSSSPTVSNCVFVNNTTAGTAGAGMRNADASNSLVVNCLFSGNSAAVGGGGMANGDSNPILVNCTFSGNKATTNGGGIHNLNSNPVLKNCIVWNNRVGSATGSASSSVFNSTSTPVISYSLVQNQTPSGTGNLDGVTPAALSNYPAFVTPLDPATAPSAAGDFQVTNCSPVLESGTNTGAPATDLFGNARPFGTNTDLGVDEFQGAGCPAPGTVWYVDAAAMACNTGTSWACAFQNLQDAINAASSGHQIWVAAGTYKPTSGTDRSISFVMKNGVEILGGFPNTGDPGLGDRDWVANVTTLSGDIGAGNADSYHVIFNNFTSGNPITSTAVLDGFTITGGNANSTADNGNGGGMYNIYASPSVTNCTFSGNHASYGGGMHNNDHAAPSVTNCTFSGNTTSQYGAGMQNSNFSSPMVSNCSFSGNTSSEYGGGMFNTNNSNPTVTHSTFLTNSTKYGGGMFNISCRPIVARCTFSGNSAINGGGMANYLAIPAVTNCHFSGNTASSTGGGMINDNSSAAQVKHCSFSGNTAATAGGGIYNLNAGSPTLTNCILWGNSSEIENSSSTPTVNYSIVQGGYSGTGNGNVDPLFVSQPPIGLGTTGDLHLQACSPAIDAGTNAGAPATDLDGLARPFNAAPNVPGNYDMGAYEYQQTLPAPTATCQNITVQLDANFSVTVTGAQINDGSTGCGTLSYKIDGQASRTFNCTDLGVNTVTLTVTDAFNNTDDCSATITVADDDNPCCIPPTVNAPTVTQPTCALPTGTIVVDASGSGTLEYSVDNGANWDLDETFSGLQPGNYYIKVRLEANPTCETAYASNPVVLTSPFTASTTDIWTGCVSTDWHTAGNWADGSVPTTADDVIIPDVVNNPVISTAAFARQVDMGAGGNLMVAASGSLTISGSANYGILNIGTVVNEGTISINGAPGFGLRNLIPGSFTNKNLLQIGNLSGVGVGMTNEDATFINQGGSITIDRCSGSAINLSTLGFQNAIFTNDGSITIGSLGTIGTEAISVQKACGGNCQASFSNTSCSALINIVASAANNVITLSGGATLDNNGGRIIENSGGNSSITSNSGYVQNLNGGAFTIGANTGLLTTSAGDIWTGCTSTDWHTTTNWLDSSVPTTTDDVNIPNVTNDPVISAAAVAKSIHVQTSAMLTNNSSLTVNGFSPFPPFISTTAFGNRGTVENNGTLTIGNVSSAGYWGLYNIGTFNNNANGTIAIDRSTNRGLYNQASSGLPGTFTNSGGITIGGAASVGVSGLFNNGTFTNNATGTIVLDRSTDGGLGAWYGTFTNSGSITIGSTVSTGSYGLENVGTFHNNAGGQINIDRSTSFGLYVNQGTFNNAGGITIGGTAAAGTEGMRNIATFNNNAGGQITIDRSTSNGIRNSGTVFNNAGNITIGGTVGNGPTGIFSSAQFNNNAGGQITIDRSTSIGLWANGPFTNADKIYIGQTAGVGGTGLISQNTFNNNAGGVILIDRCTTTGLVNQSTFNNAATITIGATASVGATGIQNTNSTTFNNSGCDAFIHIASNSSIINTGTFTNSGRIKENASGNSSITSNSGTVQNLNGGTFSITTNTGGLTTATGDIWTGCLSTDWHTDGNWFDGSVPTAVDDAVIPDAINDPVISAEAAARSVHVEAGGSLTVEATGSLPINSPASPLFKNSGTVVNEGTISLNTTASFNFHRLLNLETGTFTNNNVLQLGTSGSQTIRGIYNRGSFVNATGGSISIAKCNGGIFQDAGSFVNNAGIVFSSVNNFADSTAIVLFGGTFSNTPCSATILDQPGSNLNRFSAAVGSTFTNDGLLTENSSGPSSITNNTGIVQNLGGGSFNITNNTGVLTTNPGPQAVCCPPGNIFYVNAAATGANNGSSWADAFTDLQNALNSPCTGITQIWVAEGTYKPTSSTDRSISFNMKNGVEILGGFPNTGDPDLDDRDWVANVTTLSGEIGAAGMADNTNNIIRNGSMGATAVLDGFQLVYGNAQGGNDRGAALHNGANASPSIRNCTFMSNLGGYGGAVYNYTDCTPTFTNCAFIGNEGAAWGALFTEGSSFFTFINCSFSGNMGNPGVIYSNGMPSVLKNCIIWGNGTQAIAGLATITHSIIQGGYAGAGNLDTDPLFVSQPPVGLGVAGDLHLQICSPAIDAANDADAPANDLDGNARFDALAGGSIADMGAYEFQDEATPTVAACQTSVDAILDNTGQATVLATALNNSSMGCSPLVFSIDGQPSVSFDCSQIGSQSVTLTATYVNRTSTCATTVQVLDNTPPTITCPDNIVKNTDAGQCSAVATYSVTASDNCAYTLTRTSPANTASGSAFPVGITNVEWSVTDAGGNDTSCAFTVTVTDEQDPTITCPANIAKTTDAGQCTAVTTYTVTASDNCSYTLTRTSPAGTASGSSFPVGMTTVAWQATDPSSNSTACSFTVTVTDAQTPTINCPANIAKNTDPGQCTAVTNYTVTASDNCSYTLTRTSPAGTASGASFPAGTTTVTWQATDPGSNSTVCSFTVTVTDAQTPTITCPANIAKNTDAGQCSAVTNYTVTASDNCSYTLTRTNGFASGTSFPTGTNVVNWKVTDVGGNSTICSFTVTVTDGQNPSIVCPGNISKTTDLSQCSAVTTYANPTFSDNCGGASLTRTGGLASGSAFPKGTTMVNWKATDASGNSSVCGFTVTVTDGQLPTITCPLNLVKNADAGQCTAVVTYTNPTYSDNCTGAGIDHISGGISGAAFPKGATSVIWQATDGAGLTKRCTFTITVNDTQTPTIACPGNQTKNTDAGLCTAVTTYPTPTFTDNCTGGNVTLQSGLGSGSAFPKGLNTVVWKVTDAAGLTKTCTFRVTVNDTQAPAITCPANQAKTTDAGLCTAVATYTNATFTDNCAGGTVVKMSGLNSGSAFPKGVNSVVFKATDAAGNESLCTMTVTVTDAQLPTVTCPANIAVTGTIVSGVCSATVNFTNPTASDNCGLQSSYLWSGLASGSVFPQGVTTNVWRATDEGGWTATCAFTVTVNCATTRDGTMNDERGAMSGSDVASSSFIVHRLSFRLAPNPATTDVQITIEGLTETGGQLTVLDAQGRVVWQQSNVQGPTSSIHVSDLPSGLYQVRLQTENGVVTKGLVVSRL